MGAWQSKPFPAATMSLVASFDATPDDYEIDGLTGLSLGDALDDSSLAAAVRFNGSGLIDVLDGDSFRADTRVRYKAAATYHFDIRVDLVRHATTVIVTAPGRAPEILASGYAFPSDRRALIRLDRWSTRSAAGGQRVCGFRVASGPADP